MHTLTVSHHEMLAFLESFLGLGRIHIHPIWHVLTWLGRRDPSFVQLHYLVRMEAAKTLMKQYQFDELISWNAQEGCWIVL